LYSTLAPEQIRWCAGHCVAKVAILEDRDVASAGRRPRRPAGLRHMVLLDGADDLADIAHGLPARQARQPL
jgi:hypothetical protein